MGDVTQILSDIESGDQGAAEKLLPLVYEELRKLAATKMAQEAPEHTLQATALVHDAYLRLVDVELAQHWNSRGHFFAAAAEAMRRILVESARRKKRLRHGGGREWVMLQEASLIIESETDDLLDLDEALERFANVEPAIAELVKLRIFGGLTNDETASVLSIAPSTAKKQWNYAKAWLRRAIRGE